VWHGTRQPSRTTTVVAIGTTLGTSGPLPSHVHQPIGGIHHRLDSTKDSTVIGGGGLVLHGVEHR
jgi:hypothetical protein